jgi:hypothetical protein
MVLSSSSKLLSLVMELEKKNTTCFWLEFCFVFGATFLVFVLVVLSQFGFTSNSKHKCMDLWLL